MLVSALEGHRLWADTYEATPNPLLALEARLLLDMLPPVVSKRAVDVACGTGRWANWLADRGANVLGIDLCAEMLARFPENLQGRCALSRAETLPITANCADLTICSFAASYFPDLQKAIFEMARITRSGGRVVIADLHPSAVAAGWTRSFRDGSVYEMEHFGYKLEDFAAAARKAGLDSISEVHGCIGEPERPIFEAAGRPERFVQVLDIPAVWVGNWRKL
jgi:ubiquinone/menaquinone biosynthesis C-methylase UbiE